MSTIQVKLKCSKCPPRLVDVHVDLDCLEVDDYLLEFAGRVMNEEHAKIHEEERYAKGR